MVTAGTGRFADLADGGRALVPLTQRFAADPAVVVLAVLPNGVPAAVEVARALGAPLLGADMYRPDGGEPTVTLPDGLAGRTVLVVDDAVETGTAARLVGRAVKGAGAGRSVLAVPVCPRQEEATLALLYDEVVAAVRPLARRSLTWHYEAFEPLTPEQARAELEAYPG
ncbi:MAG: phosphoribosyltransferase family protein [Candidatus Nanopelagicales bacterium]